MQSIKAAPNMTRALMARQVRRHQEKSPRLHAAYDKPLACTKYIGSAFNFGSSPVSTRPPPTQKTSISQSHATAKLCTPCPYPSTYIPDIRQFSKHQYTELALHFQGLVKSLWRKVWFGLYQIEDKDGPSHASLIRKLYAGAGMAELLKRGNGQALDDMHRLVLGKWEIIGLGSLSRALYERPSSIHLQPVLCQITVYDSIALDNLQYMVMLLRQYEQQVDAVSELCRFLRQHQLGADEKPTAAHQTFLLREFCKRADSIAAALLDLDAQMLALQGDIDNEAREIHGKLEGAEKMVLVEEILR